MLRPLVLKGALANLATMLIVTLLPTYFVLRLGTADGPSLLGAFLALGAVGLLLGARSAPWLGRRFGATRTMWLASLVTASISLLIPLVGHGPWLVVAALAWAVTLGRVGLDNVLGVSLRQAAAPEAMAGRVNATFRFLLFGALSLGSLLAGVIGATLGIQACRGRRGRVGAAVGAGLFLGAGGREMSLYPNRSNRRAATSAATSPTSVSIGGASFHCCQYSGTSIGRARVERRPARPSARAGSAWASGQHAPAEAELDRADEVVRRRARSGAAAPSALRARRAQEARPAGRPCGRRRPPGAARQRVRRAGPSGEPACDERRAWPPAR